MAKRKRLKTRPSPTVKDGRRANGQFGKGNRFARGNPHASRVNKLRAALLNAVTPEDMEEVAQSLLQRALNGNIQAAKELNDRLFGRPAIADTREPLEVRADGKRLAAYYTALVHARSVKPVRQAATPSNECIDAITTLVEIGLPLDSVCDYLLIEHDTLFDWLQQGKEDAKDKRHTAEARLVKRFRQATAAHRLLMIEQATTEQRAMKMLQLRDPAYGANGDPSEGDDYSTIQDQRFL